MGRKRRIESLQDLIDSTENLFDFFYNDSTGAHPRGRADLTPVPQELTNWRDEQRAWAETAVLFDQSHHMPEMIIRGPGAKALLDRLSVNNLTNIRPGGARQLVCVNANGYMIGDCILYALEDETYQLVSSMPMHNWVEYNIRTGDWDVTYERDLNTAENPTKQRNHFRYQLDGPNAGSIFDAIVDSEVPDIPPFRSARVIIAGIECRVLRHTMTGNRGYEISGPYPDGDAHVLPRILEAGHEYGLVRAGARTYFSASFEGGWMAYPLPAVYTDPELADYRAWLPASSWEGRFQLAGSYQSSNIADYYVTPYEMGYGKLIYFDHDFIGRDALLRLKDTVTHRPVTLTWDKDDILRVMGSLFDDGDLPYKYINLPVADYGNLTHRDVVYGSDGTILGFTTKTGYTVNIRSLVSRAIIDATTVKLGDQVEILWGEPDGGSRKPQVERHRQTRVRATVTRKD